MTTPERRSELIREYPFLVTTKDDAIEVFDSMISHPDVFIHDGNGYFKLKDLEAARRDPDVQEAMRALRLQDKLADDGNEFLKGVGL